MKRRGSLGAKIGIAMDIKKIREKVKPVLKAHAVTRAGLFGSYASGKASKQSDVDILVKLKPQADLLAFIALKLDLEDVLGKKVDLVEYDAVKPMIRKRVLQQEVSLL